MSVGLRFGLKSFAVLFGCGLAVSGVARSACWYDCHMHNEWYLFGDYYQFDLLTCVTRSSHGDEGTGGYCLPTKTPSGPLQSPGRYWFDGTNCGGLSPVKALSLVGPSEEDTFYVKHCGPLELES